LRYHEHLPLDTASVPAAREFVRLHLGGWTGDHHIVELLATELATNAVLHAHSPFTLTLYIDEKCVRVEVTDASGIVPDTPEPPKPDATGGRGLLLVEALSTRWGGLALRHGKTMWFELDALADLDA